MKKHDEGYALVLVLVVMVAVCLAAVSIMSISVSNLQDQQASVTRMQEKYEAQGKIEQVLALVEAAFSGQTDWEAGSLSEVCDSVEGVELTEGLVYTADAVEVKVEGSEDPVKHDTLTFSLSAQSGSVQIACSIVVAGDIQKVEEMVYTVQNYKIGYTAYEITATKSDEGGAPQ